MSNILLTFEKMIESKESIFKVKTSAFESSKCPKWRIFHFLRPSRAFSQPLKNIKLALEVLHNSFYPLQRRSCHKKGMKEIKFG